MLLTLPCQRASHAQGRWASAGFNEQSEFFIEGRPRYRRAAIGVACGCLSAFPRHQLAKQLSDKSGVEARRFGTVPERDALRRAGSGRRPWFPVGKILVPRPGKILRAVAQPAGGLELLQDKLPQRAVRDAAAWARDAIADGTHVPSQGKLCAGRSGPK